MNEEQHMRKLRRATQNLNVRSAQAGSMSLRALVAGISLAAVAALATALFAAVKLGHIAPR